MCLYVCFCLLLAYLKKNSAVTEMGERLASIDMGRKVRGADVPISMGGGAGSPSNTMWPGPRPTFIPSSILVHPVVWPQYTQRYRQTGQWCCSIGRMVTCNGRPKTTSRLHVAWSNSDNSAVCYALHVFWTTSCVCITSIRQ